MSFDLQQTISGSPNQYNNSDVVLAGGGLTLVFDTAMNPNIGSWSHYEVPLTAQLWHVSTLRGPAATDEQFSQVLSNLDTLQIRAKCQAARADTGYLDNVVLVPEPQTWAVLLFGLGLIAMNSRLRVRRAVT